MRKFLLLSSVGLCSIAAEGQDSGGGGGGSIFAKKAEEAAPAQGTEKPGTQERPAFALQHGKDENEPASQPALDQAEEIAEDLSQESERREAGKDALAQLDAANVDSEAPAGEGDEGAVTYTSHPIVRFKLGKFQFEKSTLVLTDPKEKARFARLLDNASERTKNRVKLIDTGAADRLGAAFKSSKMNRGVTTSRPGSGSTQ